MSYGDIAMRVACEQMDEFQARGFSKRECMEAVGKTSWRNMSWDDVLFVLAETWRELGTGRFDG